MHLVYNNTHLVVQLVYQLHQHTPGCTTCGSTTPTHTLLYNLWINTHLVVQLVDQLHQHTPCCTTCGSTTPTHTLLYNAWINYINTISTHFVDQLAVEQLHQHTPCCTACCGTTTSTHALLYSLLWNNYTNTHLVEQLVV